jgi:hypothetical protein
MAEFLLEFPVLLRGVVSLLEFIERRDKCLGDKTPAVVAEISSLVR